MRGRLVILAGLSALIAGSFGPADAAVLPDYVLLKAVAGPEGASNVSFTLAGEVAQTGAGTLVAGTGIGANLGGYRGGDTRAADVGGLGVTVGTGSDLGGTFLSVSSPVSLVYEFESGGSLTAPPMAPGDQLDFLVFFPNGEIGAFVPAVSVSSGGVTMTVVTGRAAHTLDVAANGDEGDAVAVNGIAIGRTTHRVSATDGVVGTIIGNCSSCAGSWTSPTEFTGDWEVPQSDPTFPAFRQFAGPSGDWEWTWEGTQVVPSESSAVYGAFVALGEDWPLFRSGSGS